jgi:hypothetical protein
VTPLFICRLDPDWYYYLTEGSSSGSSTLRDDGARPPPPANLSEVGWPDPKKTTEKFRHHREYFPVITLFKEYTIKIKF